MPIFFSVDHEHRKVNAIAIGPVTYSEVYEHLMHERHRHGLSYPEFVDVRGAEITLTSDEVRQIVRTLRSLVKESPLGPTAVLVSTDVAFGIIRMLEILVEDVCEIKPFRDEQAAHEWLDGRTNPS